MTELAFLLPYSIQIFIVIVLTLVLGSFASALAYRSPRGMGWGLLKKTRSACPQCGKNLSILELVPLISWLVQRGKCKGCGCAIPAIYPLIELTCLMAGLGAFFAFGFTLAGLAALLAVPFLVALLAVDFEHMILPNKLVASLAVVGLFYHAALVTEGGQAWSDIIFIFLPAAVFYAFILWFLGWMMSRILKKEALGFGDVKFFGVAGFWLGGGALAPLCLIAGTAGVLMGVIWRILFKSEVFPFGPALILSFYICLLLQGAGMI